MSNFIDLTLLSSSSILIENSPAGKLSVFELSSDSGIGGESSPRSAKPRTLSSLSRENFASPTQEASNFSFERYLIASKDATLAQQTPLKKFMESNQFENSDKDESFDEKQDIEEFSDYKPDIEESILRLSQTAIMSSPKVLTYSPSADLRQKKRRRTSDFFKVTPILFPLIKSKADAILQIKIHFSAAFKDAYLPELQRRFTGRGMGNCLSESERYFEQASVGWSFGGNYPILPDHLLVLDAEEFWDDYILTRRFGDFFDRHRVTSNTLLYILNWRRAVNKHTSSLNRSFRQAVLTGNESPVKSNAIAPASELENEFFLHAAELGIQLNFSTATMEAQVTSDLIDFVIEMTRVVAKCSYERLDSQKRNEHVIPMLTLPPDTKVKSGKDARDCWLRALMQIPRVTPPVADTIIERFPTFRTLMRAVCVCKTEEEGQQLFEDLRLHDGEGKRLGPALAIRLYRYFRQ